MTTILCIDDDHGLAELLRQGLVRTGVEVTTASSGPEAVRLVRGQRFNLLVLDANDPVLNGSKVLAALHAFSTTPIAVLDARLYASDGAERPVNREALVARVTTALRQAAMARDGRPAGLEGDAGVYRVAGARFDPAANELTRRDGARVRLTRTESQILALLLAYEGVAVSTDHIWRHVGGADSGSDVNVVKTHLRHLRAKMAQLPGAPAPIRTLPGYGYLVPAASPAHVRAYPTANGARPVQRQARHHPQPAAQMHRKVSPCRISILDRRGLRVRHGAPPLPSPGGTLDHDHTARPPAQPLCWLLHASAQR